MTRTRATGLAACLLLALAGCAGFRGGWQSVAYVSEPPVADEHAVRARFNPPSFALPGLQLQASIDNESQTYDTAIYFGLPLSIDPRTTYPDVVQQGKTRVFLRVTPTDTSFVFRPADAILSAAGQSTPGSAGYEFAMWSADGQRVESGGTWAHRPLGESFALAEAGRRYHLSIDFDLAALPPDTPGISLDLSAALISTEHPPLPLIRFAPIRWKEGYQ